MERNIVRKSIIETVRIRDLDKRNLVWWFGLSPFLLVPELPQKILLTSKVFKSDRLFSGRATHFVEESKILL